VWAAFVNGGSIDCVFMNEVSIWRTYVRLFVTMILNDTSPLSLNRGSRYSILSWPHLVDAARMGGTRTVGANQRAPRP